MAPIVVPRAVADEALAYARDTVTMALRGLGRFVESELARRRSAAFAHEKALEHRYLRLRGYAPRWHGWREDRWSAKAYARDSALAMACGLRCK